MSSAAKIATELPVIDPVRLADLQSAMGAVRVGDLLALLERDVGSVLPLVATSDGRALLELLHRLRGSSGSLGLPAVAEAIAALERDARAAMTADQGQGEALVDGAARLMPMVAAAADAVRRVLALHLAGATKR